VTGSPIEKELVTPTGAALLVELADGFGPIPAMTITGIGYGAGTRDLVIPNVLRLVIGEAPAAPMGYITEPLVQLETNIDSDTPELLGHVSRQLLAAGALDVTLTPAQMKKDRPGTKLEVLARSSEIAALENILFTETSTLGIRRLEVERDSLPRAMQCILTPHGLIRVKVATLPDGTAKISAEYDDCRAAAEATGAPLRRVMRDAEHAAAHQFQLPHTHAPEDEVEPDEFLNP
jgi:uncharacterized protein (DUF111 family)